MIQIVVIRMLTAPTITDPIPVYVTQDFQEMERTAPVILSTIVYSFEIIVALQNAFIKSQYLHPSFPYVSQFIFFAIILIFADL